MSENSEINGGTGKDYEENKRRIERNALEIEEWRG
jgi:hypothetical protein